MDSSHQDLLSSINACYVIPLSYSCRTIPKYRRWKLLTPPFGGNLAVELVWRLAGDIQARVGGLNKSLSAATRAHIKLLPQLHFLRFPKDTTNQPQTVLSSTYINSFLFPFLQFSHLLSVNLTFFSSSTHIRFYHVESDTSHHEIDPRGPKNQLQRPSFTLIYLT